MSFTNEKSPGKPPPTTSARVVQLFVSLASRGEMGSAVAEAHGIADRLVAMDAWRALSDFNANMQRWEEALNCLSYALKLDPGSRVLRLRRAQLLEQQGQDAAALAELEDLAREARDSPSLLVHLATQLAFVGRIDEAEAALAAGLASWPASAELHKQLARLRWQRGEGLLAFRALEATIAQQPQALHLRLVAADLLRNAGAPDQALELLQVGLALAPGAPAFLTSIGVLLEGMDRLDQALPMLREARARAPQSVAARRNLIPALLRSGEAAEALALCDELLKGSPLDQLLIAQRATALRVQKDPEYGRLYDYPRVVKTFMLRPAAPFASIEVFNSEFAHELLRLHRAVRHPLEQSLRGGSQTERHLPRDVPVIAKFFEILDAPIREYIAALRGDGTHPLDGRRRADYRIAGSWSVQLQPGGFHLDHVHPLGWLSSAYYVSLPDVSDVDSRAGWLRFGQPGLKLEDCPPEHFVRPAAGMLVLFPSYMWHGTVPFAAGTPRLTAAFDVLPA
jgi:tetratricopeptide (TPR) repeat protein